MELRQLRSLVALSECGYNVTRAAQQLHLVQSAVSQHLGKLEDELQLVLFTRQGKRITGLTPTGEEVLNHARKTLVGSDNILAIGKDYVEESSGVLRIGTTHTQACYVLPPVLAAFRKKYPQINLQIQQGNPRQLVEMVRENKVDLSICTEALAQEPELETESCFRWNRSMIAPIGHELEDKHPLSIELLSKYPLITYVPGFTGAGHFNRAFARIGLTPDVVLSAADTDVVKTYVREGFGVGIIVSFAYQQERDTDLICRDLSRLFPWESTRVAYHQERYLRRYEKDFIDLLQHGVGENGVSLLGK